MNEFDSVENVQDQSKRKEQKRKKKYIASFVRKLIYFRVYKFR